MRTVQKIIAREKGKGPSNVKMSFNNKFRNYFNIEISFLND